MRIGLTDNMIMEGKMAFDIVVVDEDRANRVLAQHESQYVDMKAKPVAPAKLTRTLSAFANADGGELYVGIAEDSGSFEWDGFADVEDANGHVQCFESVFPLGDGVSYDFLKSSNHRGYVLHITISRSANIRTASDGMVYVRRSAQNIPLKTDADIRRLELDKGITSYETERVQLDLSELTNSIVTLNFMLEAFPESEPERWLRTQRVIIDDRPTVAGTILYCDVPQASLPKRSSVKIYRYKTSDQTGSRETLAENPWTIEGPLYDQIEQSVKKTTELVEAIKVLTPTGLQDIKYPPEALHEIITNALIHRDYSIADDVHVRVFDNRVEVESPGKLPGHVTVQNILNERYARNGTIVRLINKFPNPPNKDVGEGLNTAFAAMKKLQLRDPVIRELPNSVQVDIRHEKLASPEQLIVDFLQTNSEVNNSKARELTGIGSENRVKRIFERLMQSGEIERIPDRRGRATAYRLPR